MSSAPLQTSPETTRYAKRLPRDQRRQQILDAALPEFMENGFSGAHISDIAEAIGVSKPVIYSIFPGKNALATAVVEEAHRIEAERHLDAGVAEDYEMLAHGRVVPLLTTTFEVTADNVDLARFLYSNFREAPPEAVEFHYFAFEQRTVGLRHYLLQYFIGRPGMENLASSAADLISTVSRLGITQIARGEKSDPKQLAESYGVIVEGGITSL